MDNYSEIVNTKKQLVLKIEQEMDYVYPDELYEYTVYCHNVSFDTIKNVHVQVIYPENILLEEDTEPPKGIPMGDIPQQQSHLLRIKARCSTPGVYTVHFLCYGDGTGLFTKQLTIHCDYNTHSPETTHRIHIYNFTPYEEKYLLQAEDYAENVTRLRKVQKLPYKAKENPFKFIKSNPNQGFIADESQLYLDQLDELYGDPVNTDEHNYQYIGRENFNKSSIEYFEGRNLIDVINQINDESKLFKATFLKTGSNHLLNDFKQYNPNGFFYRFGLMSSELFHYLGVLPEYSYMNDVLFRWAPDGSEPLNLYPKKKAMYWDTKKWVGHGYQVFKTYTDEYKNEIIYNNDFKPFFEYIQHFDSLDMAKEYINKEYASDTTNIYYLNTDDGVVGIRKYQYIIKESYFDTGVFYIHIPLNKIPTNFYIPSEEEIEAIVQKTKPFGLKPLIRYISTTRFKHNMSFNAYPQLRPNVKFHLGKYDKLRYTIKPYKYNEIIEKICTINPSTYEREYITRKAVRLIPDGKLITNKFHFEHNHHIDMYTKEPRNNNKLKMDLTMDAQGVKCQTDNRLSYLSDLTDLLYQYNFDSISFTIDNILLQPFSSTTQTTVPSIDTVNYKLWTQSLEDREVHSRHWDKSEIEDVNFIKISLTNQQLIQSNVEIGIGFEDEIGKKHGISAEYNDNVGLFNIRYTTSLEEVFRVHKNIMGDISGLAYAIVKKDSKTMILFFIEKQENNKSVYHYFDHIIISGINEVFCFIRNEKDISSIQDLANIVNKGVNINPKIAFNTPQFFEKQEYNPKNIIVTNQFPWINLSRIDKNEYSYAMKHNLSNDIESVDDILIHLDDINIPDDAIIKNINVHAIVETNANKPIYYSMRKQDGFITPSSSINQISIYPSDIETYPSNHQNLSYYQEQYNIAVEKDISNSIKFFDNKIKENINFDNSIDLSLEFLDNIDDYMTIKKPFWCELSNFCSEEYSFNDIEYCQFVIEGYNHGEEVELITQLKDNNTIANPTNTVIPSGHFVKHISLPFLNSFNLNSVHTKFRFQHACDDIDVFDVYMNIEFKDKQNANIKFSEYDMTNIEGKKIIDLNVLSEDCIAYLIKNGLTIKLEFDDLEIGEYYRIYSLVTEIIYQNQSIDFLVNKDNARNVQYNNNFVVVSGDATDAYLSGMFFDDKPSVFQYQSTSTSESPGIELSDTLYQSFIANHDNITSITLYPNGFIGNPDINLKLGLYTNKSHTPNKLIKEINISGWSKANKVLKNESIITYNFNVNNLKIGETYWLKIEVENPQDNSYYLLKYFNSPQADFKLLTKINNNLINTFGALMFQVNSIDLYRSFSNIPTTQDILNNPNIYIGLNRGQGYITNLKTRKV